MSKPIPKKPVKVSKKKKTLPTEIDWGNGIPKDRLRYINAHEEALIKKNRKSKAKRSHKGVRAYADDSASSNGTERQPEKAYDGYNGGTSYNAGTTYSGNTLGGTTNNGYGAGYGGSMGGGSDSGYDSGGLSGLGGGISGLGGGSVLGGGGNSGSGISSSPPTSSALSAPSNAITIAPPAVGGISSLSSPVFSRPSAENAFKKTERDYRDGKTDGGIGSGAITGGSIVSTKYPSRGDTNGQVPSYGRDINAVLNREAADLGVSNPYVDNSPESLQKYGTKALGIYYGVGDDGAAALIKTVAGEAANEGPMGQAAVANSFNNRMRLGAKAPDTYNYLGGGRFGSTLRGYDANGLRVPSKQNDVFRDAKIGTDSYMGGMMGVSNAIDYNSNFNRTAPEKVLSATHYYAPKSADPDWAHSSAFRETRTPFGNHVFGNAEETASTVADLRGNYGIAGLPTGNGLSRTASSGLGFMSSAYADADTSGLSLMSGEKTSRLDSPEGQISATEDSLRHAAGTYTSPYDPPLRSASGTYTSPYDNVKIGTEVQGPPNLSGVVETPAPDSMSLDFNRPFSDAGIRKTIAAPPPSTTVAVDPRVNIAPGSFPAATAAAPSWDSLPDTPFNRAIRESLDTLKAHESDLQKWKNAHEGFGSSITGPIADNVVMSMAGDQINAANQSVGDFAKSILTGKLTQDTVKTIVGPGTPTASELPNRQDYERAMETVQTAEGIKDQSRLPGADSVETMTRDGQTISITPQGNTVTANVPSMNTTSVYTKTATPTEYQRLVDQYNQLADGTIPNVEEAPSEYGIADRYGTRIPDEEWAKFAKPGTNFRYPENADGTPMTGEEWGDQNRAKADARHLGDKYKLSPQERERLVVTNLVEKAPTAFDGVPLDGFAVGLGKRLMGVEKTRDFLSRPSTEQSQLYAYAREMNEKYGRSNFPGSREGGGEGGSDAEQAYYEDQVQKTNWEQGIGIPSPGEPGYQEYKQWLKMKKAQASSESSQGWGWS